MTNVLTQGVPLLMWFHAEVVVKMPVVGVLLTVITVILRASLAQFLLQKNAICASASGEFVTRPPTAALPLDTTGDFRPPAPYTGRSQLAMQNPPTPLRRDRAAVAALRNFVSLLCE